MLFSSVREDIRSVFNRDQAARSTAELMLAYPGLHAVWAHRTEHWLWEHGFKLLARWLSHVTRFMTGIEIHPGAQIGRGFFIDNGMGVVIGETAVIGKCVTLYNGVTLGGTSLEKGKRHPTLEDEVVVGAGAKILGNITIGAHSRIGANAVVVRSVPPNSVVVGIPGQVVVRSQPAAEGPDLEHGRLTDTIGESVSALMKRVEEIEKQLNIHNEQARYLGMNGDSHPLHLHTHTDGVWQGEDFMI